MEPYAGIDVSLDSASVCIVDAQGTILKEAKVASEPEALIGWFAAHGRPMVRVGLEGGTVAMGLCQPEGSWLSSGVARDASHARGVQGHAGEDGS